MSTLSPAGVAGASMRDEIAADAPPRTTVAHALSRLRRAIVAGELAPGQRIAQEEVAERLGVSVAPVREALRVLEREGQVTYRPRRGYFVTELAIEDLEEIYELRALLEARALRSALPALDDDALRRIELAARDCVAAVEAGDVAAELEANRRFHLQLLAAPDRPHTLELIRLLWDSTEAYRALYYNSEQERREALRAHERILAAVRSGCADAVVAELDAHRARALEVLRAILAPARRAAAAGAAAGSWDALAGAPAGSQDAPAGAARAASGVPLRAEPSSSSR
jgi:DNA-binding GntR family transcriptional regulator